MKGMGDVVWSLPTRGLGNSSTGGKGDVPKWRQEGPWKGFTGIIL